VVSLLHVGPTQVSLCDRLPESHVCADDLNNGEWEWEWEMQGQDEAKSH
jgi:hypothetical protein